MAGAFMLFVVIAQALLVVVHLAVAKTFAASFGIDGAWLPRLFVVLSFTFVSASLIAHRFRGIVVEWYYRAAAYWLGLVFFLFGGAFLFFAIASASYVSGHYFPPAPLGAVCFGLFFLLHLYGTWTSGRTAVTEIHAALPGLSPKWKGKRIVFVSDIHLGNVRGRRFAGKIARMVRTLRPEAIFIGGDLYDGGACDGVEMIEPFRAAFKEAPHGAFFVTGNHEYFLANPPHAFAAIRSLGMRILANEAADLGGLRIVGVDYEAAHRRENFRKILADIDAPQEAKGRAPTILLRHEPSDLDLARDAGISFGLFGHTHHGQIWPLSFIARRTYQGFDFGLKSLGAMQTYTSSGAGTWGPPLRLGTRSEIVCVTLE